MRQMDESLFDLCVTSPPYDNLRSYKGNLQWNEDVWEEVLELLYKVIKPGGVVVWVVGDATIKGSETGTSFRQALFAKEIGFRLHDTMIYSKKNYIPLTHNRYEQKFEYMFVFSKGKPKTFNPKIKKNLYVGQPKKSRAFCQDGEKLSKANNDDDVKKESILPNIWEYKVGFNHSSKDKIAFRHRAIFPEKLALDHILSWSNPGDLVLDPFCGSGTTGKMAIRHKRRFVGIDTEQEYLDISKERMDNLDYELPLWRETQVTILKK